MRARRHVLKRLLDGVSAEASLSTVIRARLRLVRRHLLRAILDASFFYYVRFVDLFHPNWKASSKPTPLQGVICISPWP